MKRFALFRLAVTVLISTLAWTAASRAADGNPVVLIKTSVGDIEIQLDPKSAPLTTANFLAYVKKGFYNGTVFHRIVPGFVVQGGGMTADGAEKEGMAPVKNEAKNGLKNMRGTISMARTSDPHSATSQFFLNLVDNDMLNPGGVSPDGYAVFGKIIKGLDVIDKIAAGGPRETARGGNPATLVTLISATVK